jgi:putative phosphoribosyl transferase
MPPPERVIPDRRAETEEREAEREIREAASRPDPVREARRERRGFADREDAGERLAAALSSLSLDPPVVVLAIPRGGLEIGAEVARKLDAPLDVVIPRKVGAPGNPELGLGAVAEGVRVLDERLIRALDVSPGYLEQEIARQENEISRRTSAYRGDLPATSIHGTTAVVVDDGVATGGTATAALRWARRAGAKSVVFAVPVAPVDAARRLETEADRVVVLLTPQRFFAVGQWYGSFPQVSDERVVELLRAGRRGAG